MAGLYPVDQSLTRRGLFGRMAGAAFGVSVLDMVGGRVPLGLAADVAASDISVIFLQMRGAMSHLDTFDPKPGREEQGETKPSKQRHQEYFLVNTSQTLPACPIVLQCFVG